MEWGVHTLCGRLGDKFIYQVMLSTGGEQTTNVSILHRLTEGAIATVKMLDCVHGECKVDRLCGEPDQRSRPCAVLLKATPEPKGAYFGC